MAIKGIHGLFYSGQPESVREFFRDKVKLPFTDTGGGWLIFDLPEGDLGVHPIESDEDNNLHNISFYCDDIEGTVAEMKRNGVEFTAGIQDHGYGLVTYFRAPGNLVVQLYEPRYVKGTSRPAAKAKPASRAKAAVSKVKKAAKKVSAKAKPKVKKGRR